MNLSIFVFICTVSISAGAGLLFLLGFKESKHPLFIASPVISMCVWSLVLGLGVAIGIPVKGLAYLVWGGNLFLCIIAITYLDLKRLFIQGLGLAGAALLISLPYLLHDFNSYSGSPSPDGWSYIALGQYLWEYPLCSDGGLQPLYQYAAHLCHTRFIASSFLGVFSPLAGIPGDTQAGAGFFLPWAFFVYAAACMFFIHGRVNKGLSWLYVLLCVVNGWLYTIQFANNFDQALAIPLLPVLAGLMDYIDFSKKRWGILLALFIASSIYIYPEMTPFILLAAFILFSNAFFNARVEFSIFRRFAVLFILLFALLSAVYLPTWFQFLLNQNSTISLQTRPGDGLRPELLDGQYWLMGIWGMAGDIPSLSGIASILADWVRFLAASIFTLLLGWGAVQTIKKKAWGVLVVFIFSTVSIAYFIVAQNYSYGAYKIISIFWWLNIYLVLLAVQWETDRGRGTELVTWVRGALNAFAARRSDDRLSLGKFPIASGLVQSGILFAATVSMGVNIAREVKFEGTIEHPDIITYKSLEEIKVLTNYAPVGIAVDDSFANLWAMYYLRDIPTSFLEYQSYPAQPHLAPFMARARSVDPADIRYYLIGSDETLQSFPDEALQSFNLEVVWQNELYTLLRTDLPHSGLILGMKGPYGVENKDQLFYWLNNEPMQLLYYSLQEGTIEVSGEYSAGPSIPQASERLVLIQAGEFSVQKLISPGMQKFQVPVKKGYNVIQIQCLDEPTVLEIPNGDPRVLLLGIYDVNVEFLEIIP